MKDFLVDLVEHTPQSLNLNFLKINGTETETLADTVGENREVIVKIKFNGVIPEFCGVFGIPDLSTLNNILSVPVYQENSSISILRKTQDDQDIPVEIQFKTDSGDFNNSFRLMSREVINEKLQDIKFKGVSWNLEFNPSVTAIQKLKFQSMLLSNESNFRAQVVDNNLVFAFGDHSTHSGSFVFESAVTGNLQKNWFWPVKTVATILGLAGDKQMRFSDEGLCEITVNSGLATYQYLVPALIK